MKVLRGNCLGPEGRQLIAPTVRSGYSSDVTEIEAQRAGTGARESSAQLCRPYGPWSSSRRARFPDLTVGATNERPAGP